MSKECASGYVVSVSPTKKSKNSFPYFNFKLQVESEKCERVVCFDSSKQSMIRNFQTSREPVQLQNIGRKKSLYVPDTNEIHYYKRSKVVKASNREIKFEFNKEFEEDVRATTIEAISSISRDQVITVEGKVKCDGEPVLNESRGVRMQERCALKDDTGMVRLTLWNDLIDKVNNEQSYKITHVRVKEYDSMKYLTTTPDSEILPPTREYTAVNVDEEEFNNLFDIHSIVVERVELLDHYKKSYCCRSCHRFVTN